MKRMVLLLLLAIAGAARPAEPATYRDVLVAALDLRDDALRLGGRAPPDSKALRRALDSASIDALSASSFHVSPASELHARLAQASAGLRAAAARHAAVPAAAAKDIAYPEPSPVSNCADASAPAAHAMLEAWQASAEVLAAAKWGCLLTEATSNAASLCTAIAIETEALETEFDHESSCLGAQRDAVLAAFTQTQQNVADFLNDRADVDATTRAAQTAVDALQDTLDSVLQRLSGLRTAVDEADNEISSALDDLLADAVAITAQLNALSARVVDVRFRVQVAQADVEDAQRLLADVQTLAVRMAGEIAQLRTALQTAQSMISNAQSALQTAAREQRDRRLAAALGDPGIHVIRFRLPVASGGELERSREVLIRALTAFDAMGADTAAARARLQSGDAAYNAGRPLDAYDDYARAYRLLLGAQTANVALIARNSFE
jgi:hypothetical protein